MNRHAFIATPVHSGEVCAEYTSALLKTQIALLQNSIAMTHSFCIGNALIHDARNRMVSWFMNREECTDLLFIDADIHWDPMDALKLITSPHDVIGGAYPQKRDDAELFNVSILGKGATDLLLADYIGTGFMKISKKAIKMMMKKYEDKKYSDPIGNICYGLFESPIENGKITGEDATFCRRWRNIGGKVFIDPNMTLHHIGRKAWRGNFAEVISRAPQKEVA